MQSMQDRNIQMQIGILIIKEVLENYAEIIEIHNSAAHFKQFSFVKKGEPCNNSVLYLQNPEEINEISIYPESYIFLHTETPDALPIISNKIVLKKEVSCLQVLMLLEEIFIGLNQWSNNLKESLLNEEGIKALINLSLPIFENPILYINSEYRVLFLSDVPGGVQLSDIYGDQIVEDCFLGDYMMDAIRSSAEYKNTIITSGAAIWEDGRWNGKFMNVNHLTNGIIDGCILINNCNRAFCSGDEYLLEYLLNIISKAINRRNFYPHNSIQRLQKIIKNLIFNEIPINEKQLENFAVACNWDIRDTFLCIIVSPSTQEIIHKTLLYHCLHMEELFHGSKAFEMDTQIILIIDMTKAKIEREIIIEVLNNYLRKTLLIASVSLPFDNLINIKRYYQQANVTLKTGYTVDCDNFLFLFENYALDYMIHHASGELSATQLLPQGLISVINHDSAQHTNYCKLLQTFLENDRNITKSTQLLFMHRSTFLYQLDRIKAILGMNLDDKDIRLYLILALRLLECDKKI